MWTKEVLLPVAGLKVPIYNESASVEPMGRGGVRVKWRRHDVRREVRLGAEIAFDGAHVGDKLEAMAAEFGGRIVATTGLDDTDDVEYSTHVIREGDLRRHVIVVVHNLDDHRVLQGSIECTGSDPSEVRDEWAALEQMITSTVKGEVGAADDPMVITMVNRSIGLSFDYPGGVYSADLAYGMEQLHRSRRVSVGRVVYGGLAAHGTKRCVAAMKELASDPGVRRAKVTTDDDGLVWLRGVMVDHSGHEVELIVVTRAVRGIAFAMGALVLPDEDPDPVIEVMAEAATTARRLRHRTGGRPSHHLTDVMSKMDSFRKRVDAGGHRVSGG